MKNLMVLMLSINVLFGASIGELVSGEKVSASVITGKVKYYKLSALRGDVVDSVVDNLIDDVDLYVRVGSKPTGGSYDCKSTHGGTRADRCSIELEEDAEVFVGVYGYKASSYDLLSVVKAPHNNQDKILISNEPQSSSVAQGNMDYYKILLENRETVSIFLDQLHADVDMYVQVDSKPTTESYACHSTRGGRSSEECTFALKEAGVVYIGIHGYRASDYRLLATVSKTLASENMMENAENGAISPNWVTLKGRYKPLYYPRPNLPQAPAGTGVIAFPLDSSVGQIEYYTSYMLPINDSIHKILEIDLGGLPTRNDAYFAVRNRNRPGVIIHYAVGVEVQTTLGTRRMEWDSFFNHHNKGPHFGSGNWLDYPSPVEMVRGGGNINLWNHFRVDLEQQLKLLEPNNRIIKVNYFFTIGGAMDNIKLVSE